MSHVKGRWVALSPARKMVADFVHFARHVPVVTMERRMRLAKLVHARQACAPRPSWAALFLRSFALVARRHAPLRRVYVPLPWPHLYEHDSSIGAFTLERRTEAEDVVLFEQVSRPDGLSLAELDARIRDCQTRPLQEFSSWRWSRRLAWLPTFLRRWLWRLGLCTSGRKLGKLLGTFMLTSTAAAGAGVLQPVAPVTTALHYGLLAEDGSLDVWLTFDHRVYDGAFAARVLVEWEETLVGEMVQELAGWETTRMAG